MAENMMFAQVAVNPDGKKRTIISCGTSCDLGVAGEQELVDWIAALHEQGWPPEWGNVHAAAISIARAQG